MFKALHRRFSSVAAPPAQGTFAAAIQELKMSPLHEAAYEITNAQGQTQLLLKFTNPALNRVSPHAVILKIDTQNPIAKGSMGKILPGYRVDLNTATPAVNPEFAIKTNLVTSEDMIPEDTEFNAMEIRIMEVVRGIQIYFNGKINNRPYCVMEYIQSHELNNYLNPLNRIQVLNRLSAIISLCTQVQQLHNHNIVHGDLKQENTLIKAQADNPQFIENIFLIDCGLARQLPELTERLSAPAPFFFTTHDQRRKLIQYFQFNLIKHFRRHSTSSQDSDSSGVSSGVSSGSDSSYIMPTNLLVRDDLLPKHLRVISNVEQLSEIVDLENILIPSAERGNGSYFAPETYNSYLCLKTDIYMLASIILWLLGAPEVREAKFEGGVHMSDGFSLPFRTNIVNLGLIHFTHPVYLKEYVVEFINKMQHDDYRERPPIEFVLRFFTLVYQLYTNERPLTMPYTQYSPLEKGKMVGMLTMLAQTDYKKRKVDISEFLDAALAI